MKFTILMSTRDRPDFLPQAIASIQAQVYMNWELLICADGADVSSLIPPDPRIHHFRIAHGNHGCPHAFNQLLPFVDGDVLKIADDDDTLPPDALKRVSQKIGESPWLVGRVNATGTGYSEELRGGPCDYEGLLHCNYLPCPAVYWKWYAGVLVGEFDPQCECSLDYDYWLRMWRMVGEPKFVSDVLANYRLHPGQMTALRLEEMNLHAERARGKARGI